MNVHNYKMTGKLIGDSCYRVGGYLWDQTETENERRKILDQYIRKGLEAKGGYEEPQMLIEKMKIFWNQYQEYGLKEPKLSSNRRIMNLNLGSFIWYLGGNNIGP